MASIEKQTDQAEALIIKVGLTFPSIIDDCCLIYDTYAPSGVQGSSAEQQKGV